MTNYLQHGRRHLPGGTDPIPYERVRWALFLGHINAAASTAFQYVDMTEIVTNDADLYALQLGTGPNAALHGPSVAEAGVYKITYTCDFSGTDGDKLTQYYSGDIGVRSIWFDGWDTIVLAAAGKIHHELGTHTNFSEIRIIGGDIWVGTYVLPIGEIPYVLNSNANTYDATVSCLIEKLSDTYTDNLYAGSPF